MVRKKFPLLSFIFHLIEKVAHTERCSKLEHSLHLREWKVYRIAVAEWKLFFQHISAFRSWGISCSNQQNIYNKSGVYRWSFTECRTGVFFLYGIYWTSCSFNRECVTEGTFLNIFIILYYSTEIPLPFSYCFKCFWENWLKMFLRRAFECL